MYILGFNTQHDGGCCLLKDGEVLVAISEERVTRRKGAPGAWSSIKYCLSAADIRLSDIDLCVTSSYGDELPEHFDYDLSKFGFPRERCLSVDHHLSHAYSAFFTSKFDRALVVVTDGTGNNGDSESYYLADGLSITKIGGNQIKLNQRGIGKTYEAFTSFLGWTMMQSANTMALAAYGDRHRYNVPLFEPFQDQVNGRLSRKYWQGVAQFAEENNLNFGERFAEGRTDLSKDVAAYVQSETERVLLAVLKWLLRSTNMENVCLSGGVALNCVANRRIKSELSVPLHVVPAASDKGQCLGNALYGWYFVHRGHRVSFPEVDSWGRSYRSSEIEAVLTQRQELGNNFIPKAPNIKWSKVPKNLLLDLTVDRLVAGDIVGWFQGGAELGPRALGHRSILCDPRRVDTVARLTAVKDREWFRPYAPAILSEYASREFDIGDSPYMLLVAKPSTPETAALQTILHVDGTARLQTVSQGSGSFRELLERFYARTGLAILLNTSFNPPSAPIVETPKDAVDAFLRMRMDTMVMEDFLIRSDENGGAAPNP